MSEQERILQMVDSGKLSQREAAEILAALSDLGDTEEKLEDAQTEIHAEAASLNEAEPEKLWDEAAANEAAANEATVNETSANETSAGETTNAGDDLPAGFKWVKINLLAGDIDVRVDTSLSEPVLKAGKAVLERDGEDYVVRTQGGKSQGGKSKVKNRFQGKFEGKFKRKFEEPFKTRDGLGDFLEDMGEWVSGLSSRVGDLDVRVPEGYGVFVKSKAGDVDVRGVAFLKAQLMAGDIDVQDVGGVDIVASAGDIDVDFRPTSGKHRIQASAGDVDVNLLAGSSVAFSGSVNMGDIDVERRGGAVEQTSTHIGGSARAVVGAGEATFDITLSAGDLDVTIHD